MPRQYVIENSTNTISYVIKEIVWNLGDGDCVDEKNHADCKFKCLTKKLLRRIRCRLPFMPEANIPLCLKPRTAKRAYLAYVELFVTPGSSEDCNCLPPCIQRIYITNVVADAYQHMSIGFVASNNLIETFKFERSYSLHAYLCDVGGWLGSTLGLCIFSCMEGLLLKLSSKFKKINHKKCNAYTYTMYPKNGIGVGYRRMDCLFA